MLRIARVEPLDGYHVKVELTDGSSRLLNLLPMLQGPEYGALRGDVTLFRRVGVVHGTLAWPYGQDLDPDVLLETEISRLAAVCDPGVKVAIGQFDGMTAYVSPGGHARPHVLVVIGSGEARVGIADGAVIEGALPKTNLKSLQTWLAAHRPAIALEWVKVVGGSVASTAS